MKPKLIAGVLVGLGVAGLLLGLIGYRQTTAKFNIGGLKAEAAERRTNPALAVVGGLFIVGGVILMVMDGRRS